MKIRKDSWHYRLLVWSNVTPPRNLCGYFWKVVGTALMASLLTGGFITVIEVLLIDAVFGVYFWVQTGFPYSFLFLMRHPSGAMLPILWILAALLVLVVAIAYVVSSFTEGTALSRRLDAATENSLLRRRYEAWKDGVCPTIEFIDDTDKS